MKFLVTFCLFFFRVSSEKIKFDNYDVYRLLPQQENHLTDLNNLMLRNEYDFWKEPTHLNRTVDIMVSPEKLSYFSQFLLKSNIPNKVLIKNVQNVIQEEQETIAMRSEGMDWTNYHTLEEFDTWMDDLTNTYSNVKKFVAGKTYEGRDIKGIEITYGDDFRTVFIEATIHAREWISSASTSWVVNEILKTPEDSIWRKFNYIYIPFFNPDGYIYTWTTNRLWRKTRRPYVTDFGFCYGADPNRNWDFHWNEGGCSNNPCSETYCGPSAFSEIETKTLSEYLKANAKGKKIDVYLSFHSYSQLIMYPWGYTSKPAPLHKLWHRIGIAAAKDLAAVNNTIFEVGDIYNTLYQTTGTSLEWFYGTFNSTISYTYELRDKGHFGFILPPQYILPSAKELQASIRRILIEYSLLPPKY